MTDSLSLSLSLSLMAGGLNAHHPRNPPVDRLARHWGMDQHTVRSSRPNIQWHRTSPPRRQHRLPLRGWKLHRNETGIRVWDTTPSRVPALQWLHCVCDLAEHCPPRRLATRSTTTVGDPRFGHATTPRPNRLPHHPSHAKPRNIPRSRTLTTAVI